jgi:hypothetical protein
MKKLTLTASVALLAASTALASSHREAPAISLDPAADNTDVYAWVKPDTRDFVYLIANFIPLEEPAGGPNFHAFDPAVRYEIHIARGPTSLADVVTYRIEFSNDPVTRIADTANEEGLFNGVHFFRQLAATPPQQSYKVTKIEGNTRTVLVDNADVAPPNIGPRTDEVVYNPGGSYDDAFAATFIADLAGGGRAFAGPRDDGFYVDLGGVFDLANITGGRANPTDGVSGFNTHTIALEIPTTELTFDGNAAAAGVSDQNTLGVWASASRRKATIRRKKGDRHFGRFVQVSRLGLPLINEVMIGLQDKDRFNRSTPADDLTNFAAYFLHPTIVKNAEVVGIYTELAVGAATVEDLKHGADGNGRSDIIDTINLAADHNITSIGDVLRLDLGVNSSFPNGRPLEGAANANQEQADVTDVLSTVILSGGAIAISDNVQVNDKDFLTVFPFLPLPWQGFDEGHGIAAPAP